MSSNPTVTASYTVATETTTDASSTSSGVLTFESPITLAADKDISSTQAQKEQYLNALAIALSTLQESVNSGLTERLVQQGVLSELGGDKADPSVNNKLRTKVPGQPNNSKKAQAKKQKQQRREQQKQQQQGNQANNVMDAQQPDSVQLGEDTITITPARESAALSSNPVAPMDVDQETPIKQDQVQNQDQDFDQTYKPKGGIYDDDDEDEVSQPKDEVDLVMEADPGEVDGACLELPKEEEQHQINKKRNELSSGSAADLAAAKKPKGSGDK
ncbi:hypothetical protein BG011_009790 [Mortierella polycephala]|uniref:EKC/KEOPS complex subunit GON7 n=1 Tax=Mortierella polycephala TaxID=41804 RepID=A0A9P6QA99_9FUNG|nr:hypothetical protein BG011_009790 [Mortierella polycephala]